MKRPVVMPQVEVGIDSAAVAEFVVEVGTTVAQGDPLFVVEAEKARVEVEAPVAGSVSSICVEPDSEVRIGDPVLILDVGE